MGGGHDDDLHAREEHFRLLAESSRDMISRTDGRGICTYVSPACRDVLGYEPEELVGTSLFDLVHPEEAARNREMFDRAFDGGQLLGRPFTSRMRHKNGTYVSIESTSLVLRDVFGRIAAIQAYGRDVSERVAAQAALADSQKSFRRMIDRMPNAVVVHREKRVVYANPSFAKLLGYDDPEILVGRSVLELVEAEAREAVDARIRAPRGVHEKFPEHRLIRSDGSRVVVEVTPLPVVFEGALADMAIVEDLSVRRALETELLDAERLAALGRLAAAIGHEINNPLAYVRMNLEIARSEIAALGAAALPTAERLAVIEEGIERVRAIVADVREVVSVDEGTLGPIVPAFAIERALATASHETSVRACVVLELAATGRVRAEERRLVQVLVNLLVNAAHAIVPGHIDQNEIRIVTRDEDDGTVTIEVRDTGVGLPEGDIAKLFEPFFTTKGERTGTGLGLWISQRIITSFGGSLSAERRADRGSVFRISLLRAEPEEVIPAARSSAVLEGRKLRVLLVEDERALAQSMRLLLASHDVVIEHSGQDAIARITSDASFDVVLCDLQMPSGSGADVYLHARSAQPGLEQRFVFMTGGAFTEEAQTVLRESAQPVLEKPFASRELHAALARAARPAT